MRGKYWQEHGEREPLYIIVIGNVIGTVSMGNSREVPQKTKNSTAV